MSQKIIQATCATSEQTTRLDIYFDQVTGLITSALKASLRADQVDYFYDDNHLLFAGMGDIHIHAREDVSKKNCYKEDFDSTCDSALNGGVVHVADMPNNPVPPIDDHSYLEKLKLTDNNKIPILLYAGIGPHTKPLSFKVPYKVYMGPSVGELYFKSNKELDSVLENYRDQIVSFHCEDPDILDSNKNELNHFTKRPISAELMATDIAIELIEKYNLKGKLCHYSAGEGLSKIQQAKARGLNVTCEVTPQHLYFSEDAILKKSKEDQILFQMNPPIRARLDKEMLLTALKNNQIDYLATDHAPHSREEKEKGISGLTGLDTYAAFVTWLLLDQKISAQTIAKICSENPGNFFNQFLSSLNLKSDHYQTFGLGMGFLKPGYSASFTILNLKKSQTITIDDLKTKAKWSPFLGVTFPGSLTNVFVQGHCQ